MKTLTMIARHGMDKHNIAMYTLITNDYQTVQKPVNEVIDMITKKVAVFTNLTVGPKGIESTNGALDKYTFINMSTGQVEGTPRAVILDRVEQNGKLLGYTVFTQNGIIAELNVAEASALANKGLISNGKVRHTAEGDTVSAIGGTYPLRTIQIAEAPKGEIVTDLAYFGTIVGTDIEYCGAIVSCTSATEMSKVADMLNKSNAKVIADAAKIGGQKVRESLAIVRMGANSLYGVFEVSVLEKLIKANSKVNNGLGSIRVSALKYTADGVDEATVTLDKTWNLAGKDYEGSEAADKVKAYTKKLVTKFKDVQIGK